MIRIWVIVALSALVSFASESATAGDGVLSQEKSGWANVPGGQVWLNPGDAYEHDSGLVRDRFGRKRYPTRPSQKYCSQPNYPQPMRPPAYMQPPVYYPQPQPYMPPPVYYQPPQPQPYYFHPPNYRPYTPYAPAPYYRPDYGPYAPGAMFDPMGAERTGDVPLSDGRRPALRQNGPQSPTKRTAPLNR